MHVDDQLEWIKRRLDRCDRAIGNGGRNETESAEPQTLEAQVDELLEKVNAIYQKDDRLIEFEKEYQKIREWISKERAHLNTVIAHRHAKKQYVLHHSEAIRKFARTLERLRSVYDFNSSSSATAGGGDKRIGEKTNAAIDSAVEELQTRIRALYRDTEGIFAGVEELQQGVMRLVEEYESCVMLMNRKLVNVVAVGGN